MEATKTFHYAIQQRAGFSDDEFRKKPLELIQELRIILGKIGFEVVGHAIENRIKEAFAKVVSAPRLFFKTTYFSDMN